MMRVIAQGMPTAPDVDSHLSSPLDQDFGFSPVGDVSPTSSVDDDVSMRSTFVPVLPTKQSKTLDIGKHGNTLSASPLGSILQLSAFHPVHGIVVASPYEQFDGDRFRDSDYVRRYRSRMLDDVRNGHHGFGLRIEGESRTVALGFQDDASLRLELDLGDVSAEETLRVTESGLAIQRVVFSHWSKSSRMVRYRLNLNVSVNRASYGQLTEGGPMPIPDSKNVFELQQGGEWFSVKNPNLGSILEGSLAIDGKLLDLSSQLQSCVSYKSAIRTEYIGQVEIQPGLPVTVTATFMLHSGLSYQHPQKAPDYLHLPERHWRLKNDEKGMIIRRNLDYILGNCTVPVGNNGICIITDHVALPLGWNRDNYYQIRFLLDTYEHLPSIAYPETARYYAEKIKQIAVGHLIWVYRTAERPFGYWHRSYLVTGRPKDGPVYQLDQQCYPLLEICDLFDSFPDQKELIASLLEESTVQEALDSLENHRDRSTGLYVTDETPGDDAVEYPFHFSSHVLLWYTFTRLASTLKSLRKIGIVSHEGLDMAAKNIKDAILQHFIVDGMFAYLTDGQGHHTFYHDANDLPTLFAPEWKFVITPQEHNIWKRTMDWGISDANTEGFFPDGQFHGLGSVHTRAPWPLGYMQELIYAEMRGDVDVRESAWKKITGAMFWDGMFCEAVDEDSGMCLSKAWFSWPGSVLGSALLCPRSEEKVI